MKYLIVVLITVLFLGCEVNTDSSASSAPGANPGDGPGDEPGTGPGDDPDDNSTVPILDPSGSRFDKRDAIYDDNACIINELYQAISDSSFDPNAAGDSIHGVTLLSQYPYDVDLEATKVTLFYPDLTGTKRDSSLYIYETDYQVGYDKAWETNANAWVYVRTPPSAYGLFSCYRYELDTLSGGSITKTKVYR